MTTFKQLNNTQTSHNITEFYNWIQEFKYSLLHNEQITSPSEEQSTNRQINKWAKHLVIQEKFSQSREIALKYNMNRQIKPKVVKSLKEISL